MARWGSGLGAALIAVALAGCTADQMGSKEATGTIGGAIVGGLAGSQFGGGSGQLVTTGVGTLIGAFLGSELGRSLDRADQLYAQQAAERAYLSRLGETITWSNPDTGNHGTVTPRREGYASGGAYCREYGQTITVGGRTAAAVGTACQQPDGTWRILN